MNNRVAIADGERWGIPVQVAAAARPAVSRRSFIALVALSFASVSSGGVLCAASSELESIISAWRNRQSRIRTAEIVWEQNREGMNAWSNYQSAWLPGDGHERTRPGHILKLSDGRVRYETDRWYPRIDFEYSGYGYSAVAGLGLGGARSDPFYWLHIQQPVNVTYQRARHGWFSDPSDQRRDPWSLTSVCDGQTWTDVFEKPPRDTGAHSEVVIRGVVTEGPLPFSQIMEDLLFRPILLMYRPFSSGLGGCRPEVWEAGPRPAQVAGCRCLVVDEPGGDGWKTRYFVDPHREFVPLRMVLRQNETTRVQLDIKYADDLKLSQWTGVMFSDQADFPGQSALPCFVTVDVTRCVLNEALSPEEFQPPIFPTNSLVLDRTTEEVSIVRANGSKRIVTRGEMSLSDANFSQVAATSSGNAPRRDKSSAVTEWLLWTAAATGGLAIAVSAWKRHRRSAGMTR